MTEPADWGRRIKDLIDKIEHNEDAKTQFFYYPPYDEFFPTETVDSWNGFSSWVEGLTGSWCFRGQRDATWLLSTTLDRAVRVEHRAQYSSGHYHLQRFPIERDCLFRFQQQAH